MNVITLKKGAGVPGSDQLETAELALDVSRGDLYTKLNDGSVVQLNDIPSDIPQAGIVISATEPADPVDGMQWMDATTAIVWVWDEDKWLEFPAGKGGDSGNTYTLPVSLRGGDIELPLNQDSTKLIVDTRSGPVELPLMAA